MATDATGTPTVPDNIPTYDTSVDAPSGNGFNAAMAAVQAALSLRAPLASPALTGNPTAPTQPSTDNSTKIATTAFVVTSRAPYRKVTSKQVLNTVVETDLLNGEITVAAGALGTTGVLRLTAWGDWINHSGAATDIPRFKLKLGGTTLLDTGVTTFAVAASSALNFPWRIQAEIVNKGATNSQWASLVGALMLGAKSGAVNVANAFTTGEGVVAGQDSGGGYINRVTYDGGNSGAIDTTAALALVLSVINPTATATSDTVLAGALVEIL